MDVDRSLDIEEAEEAGKDEKNIVESNLASQSNHSISTTDKSVVNEQDAFSKLQKRSEEVEEGGIFQQLEASDDLAMEGPVMGDFGDYMTLKMSKIRRQYLMPETVASQDLKASKTLFSGLTAFISTSIHIDMSEKLSTPQKERIVDFKYISRIWIAHGGVLTQNPNSGKITHFINYHIPIYFMRDIDRIRSRMRLVSPRWVLDCVANDKRLPTVDYDLQVVDAEGVSSDGQQKISFSLATKASSSGHLQPEPNPTPVDLDTSLTSDPDVTTDHLPDEMDDNDDIFGDERGEPNQHRMLTSAENPNFVADYFAASRLHHLSAWKLKFQEELEIHLLAESKKNPSKLEPPKSKSTALSSSVSPSIEALDHEDDDIEGTWNEPCFVHIDMDAFFASVATRNKMELREKPVVISHGGSRAHCASVNYAARKLGIQNGVRLGSAQQLCKEANQELVVLGYDFEDYEVVSRKALEIYLQYTSKIVVKSCDEAILDFSDVLQKNNFEEILKIVSEIRQKVFDATNCTCSAGIGSSNTLAKFALKKAKPNGMYAAPTWKSVVETCASLERANAVTQLCKLSCSLRAGSISLESYMQKILVMFDSGPLSQDRTPSQGELAQISFLSSFKLEDVPGVGWKTKPKFGGLETVDEVQKLSLPELRALLGVKIGANVFLTVRGIDSKAFKTEASERKSISVDLTYGVRFNTHAQLSKFIKDVAEELSKRCRKAGLGGKSVTIKLWIRHPDAKVSTFLGHGACNTFSKSAQFPTPVTDPNLLAATAERLLSGFHFNITEFRGFGLSLTSLAKPAAASHSITSMFKSATEKQSLKFGTRTEKEQEEPKKRLRTIDALMEKKISKATKKAKTLEDTNRKEKHVLDKKSMKLDKTRESDAPEFVASRPSTQSTRVINYTPLDAALIIEIESWAKEHADPKPVHGELIFQLAQTLVDVRNLEDLLGLCKVLLRISSSNPSWKNFSDLIIADIQQKVTYQYGAPLAL